MMPNGDERPISVASRTLTEMEKKYGKLEGSTSDFIWCSEISSISLWTEIRITNRPHATHVYLQL